MDRAFLKDRFHTDKGLLLRPQGLRGLDFLGDDWEKYRGPYRPLAEPSPDDAKRLIEFVRLVQQGDDEKFRKEIASYLDVDKFLRFMAVQAMIANADGFFTLAIQLLSVPRSEFEPVRLHPRAIRSCRSRTSR